MAIRQEEFDSYMESPCIENGEIKIEEFQNHKVAQVNRVNEKDVFLYEIELLDDGDWISIEKYTDEKKKSELRKRLCMKMIFVLIMIF